MVYEYTLCKLIYKIKRIAIEKLGNTNILIDTDDQLRNGITLKYDVILMTCGIKYDKKFHSQLFIDKALYDE